MEHRRCTSIGQQKKIAVEMWQYIKAQIEQHEPIYSITDAKKEWLKNNYPDIQWKNYCLLCDIYLHKIIVDDHNELSCSDCPLTKKYKEQAVHGCDLDKDTPWARIVSYETDEKSAVEACDEMIEALESLQGGEEFS